MTTLQDSRLARTATLCALYSAQGMPWGFVTITLLAYLAERGADVEATAGIVALATLPWSFKVVWGIVIDRFTFRPMGRRRPWLLGAQLGIAATLLAIILIDDLSADVQTLAWMVFVCNCFVSLQDVAADALAVEILADNERGRVNGMMWASNYAGVAIGGAAMGTVLANYGVQAAFVLQVSVLFAIASFPLLLRERRGERLLPWTVGSAQIAAGEPPATSTGRLVRDLLAAFRSKDASVGVVFALTASLMVGMMAAVNPVFFTQVVGLTQEEYSQLDGLAGSSAGVLGALIGGFLIDRLGVRVIVTSSALTIAGVCLTLGSHEELRTDPRVATGYLVAAQFLVSAHTVAGFSLYMRLCSASVAGTQFTLYMAATNLSRVGGAKVVGALGASGYGQIFVAMGAAMLVSLPFLYSLSASRRARDVGP